MSSIDAIEPADCYVHAVHLAAAVERLRRELGRPTDPRAAVQITGAAPRECWFAALAVHHKAARLAAELGADASAPIAAPPPVAEIKPGHVLQVIDAARAHLDAAHKLVHAEAVPAAPAREPQRTPSDVFGVLATAARQLDGLLETPTTPGEVYAQVALAVRYVERLAGGHGLTPPAFERAKIPGDCLARLHEAFDAARALVAKRGHAGVDRAPNAGDTAHVRPSDCFDLATFVLGEVAYLHALAPDANPPAPYAQVDAGHKLPSHVYQLAGALTEQLRRLAR